MAARLCILCCHNFATEVRAGVTAEGWPDVSVVDYPARCGRPPVSWEELRLLLPADCTQLIILGRACLHGLVEPPTGFPATRIVPVKQCFHLVAGEQLVDAAISGGGYLITPAWLADWPGQIAALGFTVDNVGEVFHEFARELVLLDTGVGTDTPAQLAALAAALRLPTRVVPVGLDTVRSRLARLVLEWRLDESARAAKAQAQHHASELADHVAAMDMLVRLAKTRHEEEAIAEIEDLFQMLFAPGALHYLRVEHGIPLPRGTVPEPAKEQLTGLRGEHALTADGEGFLLRIAHGEETLGLLSVEHLSFPQYRERYLNLALAVTGVCGLAIENARNRKRLLEAEKMASLGILVAGVAHEVNTPLGVCLAASTTLQSHSQQLEERFAARSMTQSDLTAYLDTAKTSTGLLRKNLERIGHLVNNFRQVAVQGVALDKHPLHLRAFIDKVLSSLGNRLSAHAVDFKIDCAPDLVIESRTDDWTSIFLNLVSNSLQHGFRGREHGTIDIRAVREGNQLRIDYRDDGNGMDAESLARIFDPFYTTDLQQGMGLGMHLVYNLIVHRMGGSIICDSVLGHGVRFHIEIPL